VINSTTNKDLLKLLLDKDPALEPDGSNYPTAHMEILLQIKLLLELIFLMPLLPPAKFGTELEVLLQSHQYQDQPQQQML
jgi:hypothetical protein